MKNIIIILLLSIYLNALSNNEIKHLLNRTTFGYTKNDLKVYSKLSKKDAINHLINKKYTNTLGKFKDIKKISKRPNHFKLLKLEDKKDFRKNMNKYIFKMKRAWYKNMINSEFSFNEKMTLFWHNHFVSEYKVVKNPYFMLKQNELFRKNALGSFDYLLHSIIKDYAMLVYLDNNSNTKNSPNENFARELMELFTLGENNYTEDDIKQSARAFTGYRVHKRDFTFKLIKNLHDKEEKIFFNQKGNFNGDDIINIILQNEQTSKFIVLKLYKEFISNTNNKTFINLLAKDFKKSNYNISKLLKAILKSDEFWNDRGKIIKSPSEFMISLVKELDIKLKNKQYRLLVRSSKNMGQILFDPPSVQGWLKDKNWINSSTLVQRNNFVKLLINEHKKELNKKQKEKLIKKYSSLEFNFK